MNTTRRIIATTIAALATATTLAACETRFNGTPAVTVTQRTTTNGTATLHLSNGKKIRVTRKIYNRCRTHSVYPLCTTPTNDTTTQVTGRQRIGNQRGNYRLDLSNGTSVHVKLYKYNACQRGDTYPTCTYNR